MKEWEVPWEWKMASAVLTYKGGNKEEPLNYRQVFLISIVAKLYEKIQRKMIKYLEKMGILTESKFGFRCGKLSLIC